MKDIASIIIKHIECSDRKFGQLQEDIAFLKRRINRYECAECSEGIYISDYDGGEIRCETCNTAYCTRCMKSQVFHCVECKKAGCSECEFAQGFETCGCDNKICAECDGKLSTSIYNCAENCLVVCSKCMYDMVKVTCKICGKNYCKECWFYWNKTRNEPHLNICEECTQTQS